MREDLRSHSGAIGVDSLLNSLFSLGQHSLAPSDDAGFALLRSTRRGFPASPATNEPEGDRTAPWFIKNKFSRTIPERYSLFAK